VIGISLESGFIGDWCYCDGIQNAYNISWTSFIDTRLLRNFSIYNPENSLQFKFILTNDQLKIHFIETDSLVVLSAVYSSSDNISSTSSIALPLNRFIVTKNFNSANLPANFRNLKELDLKIKNQIFIPIRNQIFSQSQIKCSYPSLHGLPQELVEFVFRYLKKKYIANTALTCKFLKEVAFSYLIRNKSKTD
jgi:hypothetical protein